MAEEKSDNKLHTGTFQTKKNNAVKLIVKIVLILALVAGGVFCAWSYMNNKKEEAKVTEKVAKLNPSQKSNYFADANEYDKANQVWEEQVNQAKTQDEKIDAYYQQSALALKFKKYTEAKKYAEEIKKIAPDATTPYVALAHIAQAEGDKAEARKNWQVAIAKLDKNNPAYNLKLYDYQMSLKELN